MRLQSRGTWKQALKRKLENKSNFTKKRSYLKLTVKSPLTHHSDNAYKEQNDRNISVHHLYTKKVRRQRFYCVAAFLYLFEFY